MPHVAHDLATLYRQAFTRYGTSALWSSRAVPAPSVADARAITRTLRTQGGLAARQLAEDIERACDAAR